MQKVAESYLFGAKILVHVENEEEILSHIEAAIDGVLFSEAVVKIS